MISTITTKGQVTLPKKVREKLKLEAGDKLDFFVTREGHIEAVPVKESATKLKGMLPPAKVKNVTLEQMEQGVAMGASQSDRD